MKNESTETISGETANLPQCIVTLNLVGGVILMPAEEMKKYREYCRDMELLGINPVFLGPRFEKLPTKLAPNTFGF